MLFDCLELVRARRGLQSRTLGAADDMITRGCSGLVGATRSCSCRTSNEQAGAGGASSCCSSAAFANHEFTMAGAALQCLQA